MNSPVVPTGNPDADPFPSNKTKIFIVAPADVITGGPEQLHQLADVLNRETRRAWMVYDPFRVRHEKPAPYARYDVTPARLDDIGQDSIVVLPEIYTRLVDKLPTSRVYFWWQSVDNFFAHAGYTLAGRLVGSKAVARSQVKQLKRYVERHLYQSEYAHDFTDSVGLGPASRLSDYLADEYVQASTNPRRTPRENLLVYNPSKGARRTKRILRALRETAQPMPQVVPLAGMSRSEMCEVLGHAKLYIDFGGHPGKDRIPREAAALGACVILNRRGSAANSVDVPVPDYFKIDDREPHYARLAADRIQTIMSDYEQHAPMFDEYRRMIATERARFLTDVDSLFPTHQCSLPLARPRLVGPGDEKLLDVSGVTSWLDADF